MITINQSAAGYSWFTGTGATPEVDVSLLSVLEHELGHVLGLADNTDPGDLMNTTLGLGISREPTAADLASIVPPSAATFTPSIAGTHKFPSLPIPASLGRDRRALVDVALDSIAGAGEGTVGDWNEPGILEASPRQPYRLLRTRPTKQEQSPSVHASSGYPAGARSTRFGPKVVHTSIRKNNFN